MKDCEYWIWLQRAFGATAKIDDIIEYYGSARNIYEAGSYDWRCSGVITEKQIARLIEHSPSESARIMRECADNGWDIITLDDADYPFKLRDLPDRPAVLYVDGNIDCLTTEAYIAMVGTRNASPDGMRVAEFISEKLSLAGMTVVSGGALGIDTASHMGALQADRPTIAVLGCGLGTDYLRQNANLREAISKKGLLMTEYPPFTPVSRFAFPKRNRIISGMSLGTIVIEAGEISGSLITANCAIKQSRDVFAVPSAMLASTQTGGDLLIKNGAIPVFNPKDIVSKYNYEFNNRFDLKVADVPILEMLRKSDNSYDEGITLSQLLGDDYKSTKKEEKPVEVVKEAVVEKQLPDTVSENAKKVYDVIEGQTSFDEIVEKSGLNVMKVLSSITELEILSLIEVLPGRKYKKI